MATLESTMPLQDSSNGLDSEEAVFPCKGCGEILEEGKAFELAGNRWHIDCFRCNSCNTLLDSDANLLLLGDGSLICNNCTYSCSSCGNKIEDLAILTGDQAFCANCFKCRNCKRKIENLRYARTSQGIFCMNCHESLMARRRRRNKGSSNKPTSAGSTGSGSALDKSLPALPANLINERVGPVESPTNSEAFETAPMTQQREDNTTSTSTAQSGDSAAGISQLEPVTTGSDDEFLIPVALDTSPVVPLGSHDTRSQEGLTASAQEQPNQYSSDYRELLAGSPRIDSQDQPRNRSPHIAHQDKTLESSRKQRDSPVSASGSLPSPQGIMDRARFSPPTDTTESAQKDEFKLQAAPNGRSSVGTSPSTSTSPNANLSTQTTGSAIAETGLFAPRPSIERDPSPDPGQRPKNKSFKPSPLSSPLTTNTLVERPARGDSMPKPKVAVTRKDVPRPDPQELQAAASGRQESTAAKPVLKPLGVSNSAGLEGIPLRSPRRAMTAPKEEEQDHVVPRAAPPMTIQEQYQQLSESYPEDVPSRVGTSSPAPFYGDGTNEDDATRAISNEEPDTPGLFRKMSKAVRHGRSQSDRIGPASPKWARNSRNASVDISSPITSTADPKEEVVELRNKLRYSTQRVAELEAEKTILEEKVNGTVDIRQVNTELREKRSTMAVLDTQREMVVREMEVMTEQLHKVKSDSGPVDVEQLRTDVMREFASSLGKLKDSLSGQIEDLITKKNELTNEISTLIQMKDKGFQEYESLSTRNEQLKEHNNQLVHQIQEMYKQGKAPDSKTLGANGLGIYSDQRSTSITGESQLSGDTEVDPGMSVAPKVIDIRKGQVKKFNWKKGGQAVAKNVTKGFRGAFGTSGQPTSITREDQFEEGIPYSSMQSGEAPTTGALPLTASRMASDQSRQAWGFLNQKDRANLTPNNGVAKDPASSSTSLTVDASTTLFGSDLSARCEFEKSVVPALVMSCVGEVGRRGLSVEGIYRKSGSSTQVKMIQQGFEKDNQNPGISDPDLDIHAVTGTLKQYLRRLPNPLITFECYDTFLEAAHAELDDEVKVNRLKMVVQSLPKSHRDVLEYLMLHLTQVMDYSSDNLMTPLNLAVVFAPTIMRPSSVEREISDIQAQRNAVQSMLENHERIFGAVDDE